MTVRWALLRICVSAFVLSRAVGAIRFRFPTGIKSFAVKTPTSDSLLDHRLQSARSLVQWRLQSPELHASHQQSPAANQSLGIQKQIFLTAPSDSQQNYMLQVWRGRAPRLQVPRVCCCVRQAQPDQACCRVQGTKATCQEANPGYELRFHDDAAMEVKAVQLQLGPLPHAATVLLLPGKGQHWTCICHGQRAVPARGSAGPLVVSCPGRQPCAVQRLPCCRCGSN
jgi:hypothetical protein